MHCGKLEGRPPVPPLLVEYIGLQYENKEHLLH